MRISAPMIATLLVATAASGTQDVSTDQDVVVIGRRMRLVRLNYTLNGPHLRGCDIEVSSGDARLDQVMCAVLRRCITAGYRAPRPAKRCLDASIDLFASGKRRPPPPDPIGAAPPHKRSRPAPALDQVNTAPAAGVSSDPQIVVEGRINRPAGGQWQFTKLDSAAIGRLSQVRWARCIPDGEVQVMVRAMLNGEETRNAAGRCGPMTVKLKRGRITGERSCLYSGERTKTRVRGAVSQDRLLVDQTTYLVASMTQHVEDEIRVPENDSVSKVYGERVGQCSAPARADQE